jgi:3,4-dihydroxy-2-butanone 4-phosphate synthase
MSFNTILEILEDIRAGRMVVMFDDEDRENEDDLIMSAQRVRPRHSATLAKLTVYDPPPSIFRCAARRVS